MVTVFRRLKIQLQSRKSADANDRSSFFQQTTQMTAKLSWAGVLRGCARIPQTVQI
jgi:hypothetical protein